MMHRAPIIAAALLLALAATSVRAQDFTLNVNWSFEDLHADVTRVRLNCAVCRGDECSNRNCDDKGICNMPPSPLGIGLAVLVPANDVRRKWPSIVSVPVNVTNDDPLEVGSYYCQMELECTQNPGVFGRPMPDGSIPCRAPHPDTLLSDTEVGKTNFWGVRGLIGQ